MVGTLKPHPKGVASVSCVVLLLWQAVVDMCCCAGHLRGHTADCLGRDEETLRWHHHELQCKIVLPAVCECVRLPVVWLVEMCSEYVHNGCYGFVKLQYTGK